MKAKRPTAVRGADDRRRTTPRQAARGGGRRSPDAVPRRGRPRPSETGPITRPQIKPVRPKNASQAKARAKARKAKAPKVVRPPLKERLIARISQIDLHPRALVSRVPFVVLVIGSLGLGLGVTLWLSTDAAERSYQLGHAKEVNEALMQQKEALERDVLEAQAAPALAESARELGMIPSRDTAHLVQDPAGNWVVVGTPKPAEGVPPPPLNTPIPDETPAPPPPPAPTATRRAPSGPVVEPREMVVRLPGHTQSTAPTAQAVPAPNASTAPNAAPAPAAPAPVPDASAPLPDAAAVPVPDAAHAPVPMPESAPAAPEQPAAPAPVAPPAPDPLAGLLPGPPPSPAPDPFAGFLPGPPPGPVTDTVPGVPA